MVGVVPLTNKALALLQAAVGQYCRRMESNAFFVMIDNSCVAASIPKVTA